MPQKTLSLGSYPTLTLSDVRRKRDEAKATLAEGRDPSVERKITAKACAFADGNTFQIVARRWHTLRKPNWSAVHAADVIESLENDIFPDRRSADPARPRAAAARRAEQGRGTRRDRDGARPAPAGILDIRLGRCWPMQRGPGGQPR